MGAASGSGPAVESSGLSSPISRNGSRLPTGRRGQSRLDCRDGPGTGAGPGARPPPARHRRRASGVPERGRVALRRGRDRHEPAQRDAVMVRPVAVVGRRPAGADHDGGLPGRHPARGVRRRAGLGRPPPRARRRGLADTPCGPDAAPLRAVPRHRQHRALRRAGARRRRPARRPASSLRRTVDALAPVSCHALFCLGARPTGRAGPPTPRRCSCTPGPTAGTPPRTCGRSSTTRSSRATTATTRRRWPSRMPRSRWPTGSATSWPSPACATTGPARCASSAGTRRPTRSSPACCPTILADDIPDAVLTSSEDFACVLFDMGRDREGALLVGAAIAERDPHRRPADGLPGGRRASPRSRPARPGWATSGSRCSTAAPSSASWPPSPRRSGRRERPPSYFSSKTTATEAVRSCWPAWIGISAESA